jgi:glycosyltransferase involved in cell wall biosynthesis
MHVTIDYTPALGQGAGIGRYTRGLVSALAKIDSENRYTLFSAGQESSEREWPENFSERRVNIPSRWLTVGWHRLRLPIAAERLSGDCDIFHSPDFVLPPLRAARGIVTVHDLSFMRVPECAEPKLRQYLEKSVPRAVKDAHFVLADSLNTKTDLIALLDVPAEKIGVVPPGVDQHFRAVRETVKLAQVRTRYHLPEWFILAVGTLEPRKNYPRLISAYARLRRHTGLPHQLVIAGGKGWLYDEIYQQIAREGLDEHVHFPGYIDDADLPALYTLADLLAFPSLYEGFGIPPLEAMSCGTPVVTSNNSSLPEVVGSAAIMIDAEDVDALADAMARALGNANLRVRLSDLGRAQAARYTWETSAKRLLSVYERVIAN